MSPPRFSSTQRELRSVVRRFAEAEARPLSLQYEDRGEDPGDVYAKLADLSLTGIPFDPAHGGGGEPYSTYLTVVEELARVWVSLAIGLGVHTLACDGVQRFGSEELQRTYLSRMIEGDLWGAYALSEPSSGSDAAALETTAVADSGSYRITGRKQFCTRGGEADVLLLMARTGESGPKGITAFLVEKGTEGFIPTRTENKMGWRSSPTWELVFDGCGVPASNLVGEEGQGFQVALAALDAGRLGIAATSVGLATGALEAAVAFASDRSQFGQRIIDFEGIQFMLADMATSLEAGRSLLYHAAALKDAGLPYTTEASMAKLFCSDMVMRVTIDAVQIHGGYGYVEDYPVERYMREAKALQIVEGTNQIQRMIIGRHLAAS